MKSLAGSQYRVTCTLYSKDGKRSAEVREFLHGETYLLESDWVEGTTFAERHSGRLVGPFASPTHAERFIVATSWFNGIDAQAAVTRKCAFLLFTGLYLLSFAVLIGWFLLLLVGLQKPRIMTFANAIAVPTLLGSVLCLAVFKRLARGAERRRS